MLTDPDRAAHRLAARQLGIITWAQARYRAGLTQRQIEWRLATNRWRELQPQVYAVDGTTPSWHRSLLAAQRRARTEKVHTTRGRQRLVEFDDAAICGRSAVWLRRCRRLGRPQQHEILVERLRAPAIKGARVRRTRCLPASDVDVIDGIPTLALPRLLVELSCELNDVDFVAVVDDLLSRCELQMCEEVHRRAVELSQGRRGPRRLAELTAPGAAAHFRSWLERHTAALLTAAGMAPAQWNLELRDAAGKLIGEADAVWVEQRVVVELDGLRFHSSPEQRRRDNRKDRRLGANGWGVLRYTWLDVMERPNQLVAELRQALGR